MKVITRKRTAISWGILASAMLIVLLLFSFNSSALAVEGEQSALSEVTSSDNSIVSSGGSSYSDQSDATLSDQESGDSSDSLGGDNGGSGEDVTEGSEDVSADISSTMPGDSGSSEGSDVPQGSSEEEDGTDLNSGSTDGSDEIIFTAMGLPFEDDGTEEGSGGEMMLMAATEEEEATPTGIEAPAVETVPEYQIPEGSAYIFGSEATVYENTATQNAIQQAIEAAKATAASNVTIIVNNGVYTGAIQITAPAPAEGESEGEVATPADNVLYSIIAADAFTKDESSGEITANANSAGGVGVEGDLNFEGIDVLLAGIYLSLKNTIKVSDADNVAYYGTGLSDEVKLELSGVTDSVTIDMGGGDDVLDLSVKQSPTVTVSLTRGEGFDTDTGALTESGESLISEAISNGLSGVGGSSRLHAVIDGGQGDDEITITLINSTDISTTGDEQANTTPSGAEFSLDLSATDLNVNGGAGADTVTVDGGMELGLATVLLSPIIQEFMEQTKSLASNGTTILLYGGDGDDLINVDTTVSFSSFRSVDVVVDGGNAYDRTNLIGKLQEYDSVNNNLSGNASLVEMGTLAEISVFNDAAAISRLTSALSVSMSGVEAVTDELDNKHTVNIGDLLAGTDFVSFTDYILDGDNGTVNYANTTGSGTFLTNLVIKGRDVTVGNVWTPHVNIVISGADSSLNQSGSVTIVGTVTGKNISIKVKNTDSHALEIVDNDLTDEADDYALEASLFDIVSDAVINIAATASLTAVQTVNLEAGSKQTKPLVPTLEELTARFGPEYADTLNINFVAVKVGKAEIDIQGTIEAAAIHAVADALVNVSALNDNLAAFGIPLAVGVVVSDAKITSTGNARMKATQGGIFLNADSDVTLETSAVSGLLPFTLAVSAVVNDSCVDIKGNTGIDAEGDIIASAYGWTNITTSASGPKAQADSGSSGSTPQTPGQSGGFFAISVAVQNVFASITENATADARGGLALNSSAFERVSNKATSNPDDGGTSFSLANLINKVSSLLTKSSTTTTNGQSGQRGSEGMTGVTSRLNGTDSTGSTNTGAGNLVNTGTAGSTGGSADSSSTSSTQLVGALAVTYAENTNKAFINTTGTIECGGTLALHAIGSMVDETLADGSPIKRTSTGATGVANAGAAPGNTGMTYEGRTQGKVTFATTQNGFLIIDKTAAADQTPGATIVITPNVSDGYTLNSITVNGTVLAKTGEQYSFTMPNDGSSVTLGATFDPKRFTITSSNINAAAGTFYTSPIYGDEGDSIIVHITPNAGYSVTEVLVTYTGAAGSETTFAAQQVEGQTNQYRLTMPAANVIVKVNFEGVAKELYLDNIINGTVTVKDKDGNVIVSNDPANTVLSAQVQVGTALYVEIIAAEGYRLKANSLKIGTTTIIPTAAGIYQFSMPNTDAARIGLGAIFEAGSATKPTASRTGSIALGVGVAVTVVNYNNEAFVSAASTPIKAGGLDITALSANLSSAAISRAGFTAADLGLAGALTVHVLKAQNSAELNEDIILSGGSLNVKADVSQSKLVTVADAAGKSGNSNVSKGTTAGSPSSDSVGIGAGIAIAVIGVDSFANIGDAVSIRRALDETVLDAMNVTASYNGSEKMTAKAGASGGTAIVPVLALDISGIYVDANTGTNNSDALLIFGGDVNITAANQITRNILADAAAVGGGVGAGGTFIIDIINDSATATQGRSIRGRKVYVKADSVSRLTANGKASASGATSTTTTGSTASNTSSTDSGTLSGDSTDSGDPDPDPDPDPDDPYDGISNLFEEGGETTPPEEDDYSEDFANLFKEGEADAIADDNTQAASNMADAAGTKNVTGSSVNSLTANRQKAETSEGSVQLAATFTLNIQKNISRVVIADGIVVESEGEIVISSKNDTDAAIVANASATNSTTGVGVAVAINIVTYENTAYVGDCKLKGTSLTISADIYEEEAKKTLEELVGQLLEILNAAELANGVLEELNGPGTTLETYIKDQITSRGITLPEGTSLDEMAAALAPVIAARLQASLNGTDVADSVNEDFQDVVMDTISYIAAGLADAQVLVNVVKNNPAYFQATLEKFKDPQQRNDIIALAVKAIAAILGSNDELDGIGHKISTQTVSGVGAANVGVAGSAAISVVNGLTQAVIADRSALREGEDINISGDIIITANGAQKVYTTASSSADGKGRADKNKAATNGSTATNNGTADTTSASGSGTTSGSPDNKTVGVGAAFALSIADLTVYAGIGCNRRVDAASIKISSLAQNDLDTVSVSGSDPVARSAATNSGSSSGSTSTTTPKDISVDASVSVSLIQNDVKAYVGQGSQINTTAAADTIETDKVGEKVNFYLYARQSGETQTNASGFAVGNSTSVGAAVAVNIALSTVVASFAGHGTINGRAKVAAATYDEDEANALAVAMGADLDRYLSKFRAAQNLKTNNTNGTSTSTAGNNTSSLISGRLSSTGSSGGSEVSSTLPVSTNALHAQNASSTSTSQASASANDGNLSSIINETASGSSSNGGGPPRPPHGGPHCGRQNQY
jgi:hypothetical protein